MTDDTKTTPRWTDATVELVATALHGADCIDDLDECLEYRAHSRAARAVLADLADAGLLLPPGGYRWVQWAVQSDVFDDGWWFIDPSEQRARVQAELTGGILLCRDVVDWPGDEHHRRAWPHFAGPWREVQT